MAEDTLPEPAPDVVVDANAKYGTSLLRRLFPIWDIRQRLMYLYGYAEPVGNPLPMLKDPIIKEAFEKIPSECVDRSG